MRAKRSRFTLVRAGALCAVAGLLTLAACEARVPTSAELTSMDVAAAEKAAAQTGAFKDASFANADYFLDGKLMGREQLMKLDGKDIGSLTVVKSKMAGGRDTIFVVTRDNMTLIDSAGPMRTKIRSAGTSTTGNDRSMLRPPRVGGAAPAIMIDGKISTEAGLASVREDDIVAVNILKPKQGAAEEPYPDGLIAIETKANAAANSKMRSPKRAKN